MASNTQARNQANCMIVLGIMMLLGGIIFAATSSDLSSDNFIIGVVLAVMGLACAAGGSNQLKRLPPPVPGAQAPRVKVPRVRTPKPNYRAQRQAEQAAAKKNAEDAKALLPRAREQLGAGQLGAAKATAERAVQLAGDARAAGAPLLPQTKQVLDQVQGEYAKVRAGLEKDLEGARSCVARADWGGAEAILAATAQKATAAGIAEVDQACKELAGRVKTAQDQTKQVEQQLQSVAKLLQDSKLGDAKSEIEKASAAASANNLAPDLQSRVAAARAEVTTAYNDAWDSLQARFESTLAELAPDAFDSLESAMIALASEAQVAGVQEVTGVVNTKLADVRTARARYEAVEHDLAAAQQDLEVGRCTRAKKAAEDLASRVQGRQDIGLDTIERVEAFREQAFQAFDQARNDLRASLDAARESASAQRYGAAEKALVSAKDQAATAEFTDIVQECDQRIPIIHVLSKVVSLFKIAKRILISDLATAVNLSRPQMLEMLMNNPAMVGAFKIDGDYVSAEDASAEDVSAFIEGLHSQFETWGSAETTKEGKVASPESESESAPSRTCPNCGSEAQQGWRVCPICGSPLPD
jgi:hypothetical protein